MDERERDEYEVLRSMVDDLPDGIVTTDASGLVNEVNPAAAEIFGRSRGELAQEHIFQYLEDEYGIPLAEIIGRDIALSKAVSKRHVYVKRPDGTRRSCTLCVRPLLKNGEILRVYGIFRDRTELEQLLQIDEKSGLLNHRTFVERVNEQILMGRRKDEPCALVYMDMRRFKELNDEIGHREGDRVILQIGHRLQKSLFRTDFKARSNQAGDEFMVLLTRIERQHLAKALEKIVQATSFETELVTDRRHVVSVSIAADIGACWRRGAEIPDADDFITLADTAMRTCKRRYKGGEPCAFVIDAEGR